MLISISPPGEELEEGDMCIFGTAYVPSSLFIYFNDSLTRPNSVPAVSPRLALWLKHVPIVGLRDAHTAGQKRFEYSDASRLDRTKRGRCKWVHSPGESLIRASLRPTHERVGTHDIAFRFASG